MNQLFYNFGLLYDYRTLSDLSYVEIIIRFLKRIIVLALLALVPLQLNLFTKINSPIAFNYLFFGLILLFFLLEKLYLHRFNIYKFKKFSDQYYDYLYDLFYSRTSPKKKEYLKGITIAEVLSDVYLKESNLSKFLTCIRYRATLLTFINEYHTALSLIDEVMKEFPYDISESATIRAEKARMMFTEANILLHSSESNINHILDLIDVAQHEFEFQGLTAEREATEQALINIKKMRPG